MEKLIKYVSATTQQQQNFAVSWDFDFLLSL